MADNPLASVNPLANFKIGSLSTMANIFLVIFIVVMILGLAGFLIYLFSVKKKYWIQIEASRLVGGVPQRVGVFSAREVYFGRAGDKLWRVAPKGVMKFKLIKWLPVGKLQSAPNMFKYWIREDGEWINFIDENLDETSRKMRVKFVQEDMRLQRLATDRLLEQRLMQKSFWDKWGNTIMTIILFLVIAVAVAIIFFQFSKIVDKLAPMIDAITKALQTVDKVCSNQTQGGSGLIPA